MKLEATKENQASEADTVRLARRVDELTKVREQLRKQLSDSQTSQKETQRLLDANNHEVSDTTRELATVRKTLADTAQQLANTQKNLETTEEVSATFAGQVKDLEKEQEQLIQRLGEAPEGRAPRSTERFRCRKG